VWTALDPLPEVVARACESDVDVLVTHHPLFFKPVTHIDCETPLGRIVEMALSRRLAIFSAHTNLDSVPGGVNDVLAGRMGLRKVACACRSADADMVKLVVFVPSNHVKAILDTLYAMDAGRMAIIHAARFRCEGVGTFLPGAGRITAVGKPVRLRKSRKAASKFIVAQADLERGGGCAEKGASL
jgi:putative NIF3 family GTP cyclohydrolase 1 type 2